MPDYHFDLMLGPHLTDSQLSSAASLLSDSYSKWQQNPKNTNPVQTDTSPEVYSRIMRRASHEVVLYYECNILCGVFVHALSSQYDRYPLRKLSYLGVSPRKHGYDSLITAFKRYTGFIEQQGEDVVITSDLDQVTLNNLLESAGFCEVVDRNETFFLLSQLMQRKIFSFQKVKGDFVLDQIIKLDGKAVRRDKKLLKLQTTPYDFYELYTQQQSKRVRRSIPLVNLTHLQKSLSQYDQGIFFISSFEGTISSQDAGQGGYNSTQAIMGNNIHAIEHEIIDSEKGIVYLLPAGEEELRAIADKIVLRQGFYDFLFYCLKILGSFYITSAATPQQTRYSLERFLSPSIPLRFIDLIEEILTPDITPLPDAVKYMSDNTKRHGYLCSGPFVDLNGRKYSIKKDAMVKTVLNYKGDSPTPVVYLGGSLRDASALRLLFKESLRRSMPVVVFDFSTDLTQWVTEDLINTASAANPFFSIISVRDFYQIPVMLEAMGLYIELDIDTMLSG